MNTNTVQRYELIGGVLTAHPEGRVVLYEDVRAALASAYVAEQPGEWVDTEAMRGAVAALASAPVAGEARITNTEAADFADKHGMYYDMDQEIAGNHARALLAAYAAPQTGNDPIRAMIAKHAELLVTNEYAYFELARTRRTGWMAWLCSHHVETHPDRKILACGQGDTPKEACRKALADFDMRATRALSDDEARPGVRFYRADGQRIYAPANMTADEANEILTAHSWNANGEGGDVTAEQVKLATLTLQAAGMAWNPRGKPTKLGGE